MKDEGVQVGGHLSRRAGHLVDAVRNRAPVGRRVRVCDCQISASEQEISRILLKQSKVRRDIILSKGACNPGTVMTYDSPKFVGAQIKAIRKAGRSSAPPSVTPRA